MTSTAAGSKVFISYSSADKAIATAVAMVLAQRNLSVWFDDWHLARGADLFTKLQEAIRTASAALILIGGGHDMGPWSRLETGALLTKAINQKQEMPIIPVLLPGAPDLARELPLLATRSAFDMKSGVNSESLAKLAEEVERSIVLGAAVALSATLGQQPAQTTPKAEPMQPLDLQAVVGLKYRLHVLANYVADEARLHALVAHEALPHDVLTTWVPALVALLWNQGYAAALRTLLGFEGNEATLSTLPVEPIVPPCRAAGGIVSATEQQDTQGPFIAISVADQPAARLREANPDTCKTMVDSINAYGRLAAPRSPRATLLDRIGEIPIRNGKPKTSNLAQPIQRNLQVLAAVVARFGVPDHPWFRPGTARPAALPKAAAAAAAQTAARRRPKLGSEDRTPPPEAQ
jgi:hypothetical protein